MMSLPSLLLVEDDRDTAALIMETLCDHFGGPCVMHCPTVATALQVVPEKIDLVLTDMNLPDGSGTQVLQQMLAKRADLPIIVVTAESVLEHAIACIRQGAYDYVVKSGDYLFAIPLCVEKNLAIWRTKRENQRLENELKQRLEEINQKNRLLEDAVRQLQTMAATDPLTGLANRRAFTLALERAFAEAVRHQQDLTCVMIDLDYFKEFNDTFGHQCGDDLLKQAAQVIASQCRKSDVAGRYGGDELVMLLPQTDQSTALVAAQRIRDEFHHMHAKYTIRLQDGNPLISMSMGIASLRSSSPNSPEQLVGHADHALYRAKQMGKHRIVNYPSVLNSQSCGPRLWVPNELGMSAMQ